jgi:hypothetical protein
MLTRGVCARAQKLAEAALRSAPGGALSLSLAALRAHALAAARVADDAAARTAAHAALHRCAAIRMR